MTTQDLIKEARRLYQNDDIQIDDNAEYHYAGDDAWVQAWVYVTLRTEEDV
jgi:hypothetical protein